MKDLLSVAVFLTLFAVVVFFVPTFGGIFLEAENFEPANPVSTPEHIAPVWYFTPFYAILRAVPDQRLGALLMLLAVLSLLFLPWLDRSSVRSIRYKGAGSRARSWRCSRFRSWRSGTSGCSRPRGLRAARPCLHGLLLRVLLAHADLHRSSRHRFRCPSV